MDLFDSLILLYTFCDLIEAKYWTCPTLVDMRKCLL